MQLPQLRRIRWAVRAALFLGVAASVAANVLHAQPNPISQTISAWPPLALLLTVELTSRIPMHRPLLAFLRVAATIAIAGIAAWVSYWHMQDVAVRYGETKISAYLLPVSVDGLIVVASVSLVELAGRIRVLEERRAASAPAAPATDARQVAPVRFVEPAPTALVPSPAPVPVFRPDDERSVAEAVDDALEPTDDPDHADAPPITEPVPAGSTPIELLNERPNESANRAAPISPAVGGAARPAAYANGSTPARSVSAAVSAPPRAVVTAPAARPATESNAPRQRRPIQETADLADEIEAMHPDISQNELARRLGISATRLRAVRREAREARRAESRQ